MAGTTQFPVALDAFPAIEANTDEAAPGVEHDVVHANVHAALAAVQQVVGVTNSVDGASLQARHKAVDDRVGAIEAGLDGFGSRIDGVEADVGVLAGAQSNHDADPDAHATPAAVALVAVAGVVTMDCSAGQRFFTLALDASATLAIVNAPAADCLILRVVPSNDALLTLPAGVALLDGSTYAGGTAPHVVGLMTFDAGSSFDAVVGQS